MPFSFSTNDKEKISSLWLFKKENGKYLEKIYLINNIYVRQ